MLIDNLFLSREAAKCKSTVIIGNFENDIFTNGNDTSGKKIIFFYATVVSMPKTKVTAATVFTSNLFIKNLHL